MREIKDVIMQYLCSVFGCVCVLVCMGASACNVCV
jgi:hypothetical protein